MTGKEGEGLLAYRGLDMLVKKLLVVYEQMKQKKKQIYFIYSTSRYVNIPHLSKDGYIP